MFKSKTILAGTAVALLGLFESFNITDFTAYIPDAYEPMVVSGVGFLMIVLRFMTTKPLSDK